MADLVEFVSPPPVQVVHYFEETPLGLIHNTVMCTLNVFRGPARAAALKQYAQEKGLDMHAPHPASELNAIMDEFWKQHPALAPLPLLGFTYNITWN